MANFNADVLAIVERDPRYTYEAYEFVERALQFTLKRLGRERGAEILPGDPRLHVSGKQLLGGIRELALVEFGMMARTVFRMWGVERTDDFGNIVFNLIEAGLMSKSDNDRPDDFRGVFDFDKALDYQIQFDEAR
jgi:uncharacterized repeat protein (TIGR04138 family)